MQEAGADLSQATRQAPALLRAGQGNAAASSRLGSFQSKKPGRPSKKGWPPRLFSGRFATADFYRVLRHKSYTSIAKDTKSPKAKSSPLSAFV